MPPVVSEEYKEKRKKKILSSALACFAEKGFASATIDDIVAHAGMSKGSIYNYYKSKAEIYVELLHQATANNLNQIIAQFSKAETAIDKMALLFDEYLGTDPQDPKRLSYIVVFYEFIFHCTRDEELLRMITDRRNDLIKLVRDVLYQGQQSGEIKQEIDPDLYAHKFWSYIDGVSVQTVFADFPYHLVLTNMKEAYLKELRA